MKHSPQTRQYRTMRRISLLAVCFLVLIVTALIDARYATGQAILMAAALLVYALPFGRVNRQLQKQLDAAARKLDSDSLSFLDSTLPVAAIRRNGALVWYNEAFHELIGQGPAPGRDIREAIPGFQPQKFTEPDLMDGVSVSHAQRAFRVYASPLRELGQKNDLLLLTFFDVSEHKALQAEYKASRPVVAHIIIDNLDEISQNARESDKAMVVGGVDNVLSAWAAPTGGILQLTERGRYLFVFEERYLPGFIADKFSVLDSVRTLGENGALEPTISIGGRRRRELCRQQRAGAAGPRPDAGTRRRPSHRQAGRQSGIFRRQDQNGGAPHQGQGPYHGAVPGRVSRRGHQRAHHGPPLCRF